MKLALNILNMKLAINIFPDKIFPQYFSDFWSTPWHFPYSCQTVGYLQVFQTKWSPCKSENDVLQMNLFLHLFEKRTFVDKWHQFFKGPDALPDN